MFISLSHESNVNVVSKQRMLYVNTEWTLGVGKIINTVVGRYHVSDGYNLCTLYFRWVHCISDGLGFSVGL